MITELSLDTGGRFQVFMLVDVKDNSIDLLDDHAYAQILEEESASIVLKTKCTKTCRYSAIHYPSLTLFGNWKWMQGLRATLRRCSQVLAIGPSFNFERTCGSEMVAGSSQRYGKTMPLSLRI
jgi:hypothetical protein